MEATAIVTVWPLTWLLIVARMIYFLVLILYVYLSRPSRPSRGLYGVGGVVIPLAWVGDTKIVSVKSWALLTAAVRMVHFLVAMLSRPRSSRRGLDGDAAVMGLLGGGYGNRLGRVLGVAAGGGEYN
jgi:hypothetical protein